MRMFIISRLPRIFPASHYFHKRALSAAGTIGLFYSRDLT